MHQLMDPFTVIFNLTRLPLDKLFHPIACPMLDNFFKIQPSLASSCNLNSSNVYNAKDVRFEITFPRLA